ncbi:serine hydrolase domain-containing protein [Paludisphaera rhizosphaerae]|uniref:serine hydrolase domain-containing protein n=1 Tax=Paludisphaera rhizosphaerae TaxID=2711216 RepID=UPI0013EA9C11|nr:serine hydrolase domain-containing protein [Paludisphaera rhizosphaerae]
MRWFDAAANEAVKPDKPGPWVAVVESKAPNGTVARRSMTFYVRPPMFLLFLFPATNLTFSIPPFPSPIVEAVWREHQSEIDRDAHDLLFRAFNDSEAGARLLAGLGGAPALGRPPKTFETAAARVEEMHLSAKRKLHGLPAEGKTLKPPQAISPPAPALHEGTAAEAGVAPELVDKLRALCREWAEDSKQPFTTLVARRGVVVLHEAFGRRPDGRPAALDDRNEVFSITKTATAILFSRFLESGLVRLDDPISTVLPDYPKDDPHVPTFRQCFTHTAGLAGHGDFGGMRNVFLDNVVLNGLDAVFPGDTYAYSGMGFDLSASAMELITGKASARLYHDELCEPFGLGDVPFDGAAAGGHFTAFELGVLAQWLANGGAYGDRRHVSPEVFASMLPEPVLKRWPKAGYNDDEGIGMHWLRIPKPGAPANSKKPEDLLFGPRMVGHGSLSQCMLMADLDSGLIITQSRSTGGPKFAEWSAKFYKTIAEGLRDGVK